MSAQPALDGLERPVFTLICGCAFCSTELGRESYALGDDAEYREAMAFAQLTLVQHARECPARTSPDSGTSS